MNKWKIRHPGQESIESCQTFSECMEWFEGFNCPYLEGEEFKTSHRRVKEYFAMTSEQKNALRIAENARVLADDMVKLVNQNFWELLA